MGVHGLGMGANFIGKIHLIYLLILFQLAI